MIILPPFLTNVNIVCIHDGILKLHFSGYIWCCCFGPFFFFDDLRRNWNWDSWIGVDFTLCKTFLTLLIPKPSDSKIIHANGKSDVTIFFIWFFLHISSSLKLLSCKNKLISKNLFSPPPVIISYWNQSLTVKQARELFRFVQATGNKCTKMSVYFFPSRSYPGSVWGNARVPLSKGIYISSFKKEKGFCQNKRKILGTSINLIFWLCGFPSVGICTIFFF